ncbi:MAG: hypothetical protein RQ875_07955 [Vicingaceae bacterium]|nr:hypothetical protein [Vicingaceae bacterium]
MKKIFYTPLLIVFIFTLFSCETKVDLNAEFKDITVVYGLINPSDSVHYVKINKVFLPEDGVNANTLAANQANFNYAADELTVTVDEYRGDNGNFVASYSLLRTENEIPKDEGVFDNSVNVLYKFTAPTINRNNIYQLKIYNSKLDKEITSETLIVGNSSVTSPTLSQKMAFWIGGTNNGGFANRSISFNTGKNVGRIDAKLIFNYTNYFVASSGIPPQPQQVVMRMGELKTTNSVDGNELLEWTMEGATFFDNIAASVPTTLPNLSHREIGNVDLQFVIAGTELNVYMEVTEPSNTVNQDKPNYTNVENGLGIFSSRETLNWISTVDPNTGNLNITAPTIEKLSVMGLSFCFGNSVTSNFMCPQ